jgi:peptidyl-prolyl cis-trans isomerase A (cyclophilin A)
MMLRIRGVVRGMMLCAATLLSGCGPDSPQVELRTQFGVIRVEVDSALAPKTAANFLRYVDEGRYATASFYRVRSEDAALMRKGTAIVQGGLWYGDTTKMLPPIPLESTRQTGLKHVDGAIAMARFDSVGARGEFYIVIGDQPHLDYRGQAEPGYAVFGRVVQGMELVREIRRLPAPREHLARRIPFTAARSKQPPSPPP